jgi:hypothetical protein
MQDYVKEFFSHLHNEYLKARGYKKVRHTFSRDFGTYTERIQFQGSAWNDSSSPWRFYINFGVEFHDVPAIERRDFPGTHCWTRIQVVALDAPSEFDLSERDTAGFASKIAFYLESGSRHVKQHIQQIRSAYDAKICPQFPAA